MEKTVEFSADELRTLFGNNDRYMLQMEKELSVSFVNRNGTLKIEGEEENVEHAINMMKQLLKVSSNKGIEEQEMNYAISLSREKNEDAIEILSGPNVQTFFSVVPRKQFRIDGSVFHSIQFIPEPV